jgi:hypothetical protein
MILFLDKFMQRLIITLFLLCPITIFAISSATVTFLLIEPGARAEGIGGAFVAYTDDGTSSWWNPGAMALTTGSKFAIDYSFDRYDTFFKVEQDYYFLGFNSYFESLNGSLGFHAIKYKIETFIQEKNKENYNAYAFSYGYRYSDSFGIGTTIKYIQSEWPNWVYDGENGIKGSGFAFDIGLKKEDIFVQRLDIGFNLQNIGADYQHGNFGQRDPLPMNFRLGLSYRTFEDNYHKVTLNGELNKPLNNRKDPVFKRIFSSWSDDGGFMSRREIDSTVFKIGVEYVGWDLMSFRLGYIRGKSEQIDGFTMGTGVHYIFANGYKVNFDFALNDAVDYKNVSTKTFTLGVEF